MNALSSLLALGAMAVPAAWAVGVLGLGLLPALRRLPPVPRAQLAAWLQLLPAAVAGVALVAIALPSVSHGLGFAPDHCLGHDHHAHVCFWHGAALPPALAALGASAWAVTVVRLGRALSTLARTERVGAELASLGTPADGVTVVPATVPVCHTVGVLQPRVLVSRAVVDALTTDELRAVLAHERAHLERSDPRWSAVLALAACVAPLSAAASARVWREAAEDAADDAAAHVSDGPTVARALVAVSRLGLTAPGFAFAGPALERRVQRLLGAPTAPRVDRTGVGAGAMALAGLGLVTCAHSPLHHTAEEGWTVAVTYYNR